MLGMAKAERNKQPVSPPVAPCAAFNERTKGNHRIEKVRKEHLCKDRGRKKRRLQSPWPGLRFGCRIKAGGCKRHAAGAQQPAMRAAHEAL